MGYLVSIVVLSWGFLLSGSVKGTTYFEKSGSEDLATSASGFSYQVRSSSPLGEKSEYEKKFEEYKSGPSLGRYSYDPVPLDKLSLGPKYQSLEPNYGPVGSYRFPYAKGYDNFLDDDSKGPADDHNFAKSLGLDFLDSHTSTDGEESSKAYSAGDRFAIGRQGRRQGDAQSRFQGAVGSHHVARSGAADAYSQGRRGGRAEKGGSFADEHSHDKGSRTTGYEKVYRKEEFKKDRSFYDDKKDKGHFNRYGNFDTAAASEAGASTKDRKMDAAFEAEKHGAKGFSNKDSFANEAAGYRDQEGDAKFYRNGAAYANKGGKSIETAKGYSGKDD